MSRFTNFLAFLLAINTAYGLVCYKCDSSENKLCNYAFTSFTYPTVDCQSDSGVGVLTNWIPKQCVKIVAKARDGSEYIARGCAPHLTGACTAVIRTFNFFANIDMGTDNPECYECNGDKCNSAIKMTGITFLGLVLTMFACLF